MPTADREGLWEKLAEAMLQHESYPNAGQLVPFAEQDASVRRHWLGKARALAGPLSALLAQADTAERMETERDDARALIDAARGEAAKWPHLEKPESVAGLVMVLAAAARQAPLGEHGNVFVLQHLTRAVDAVARLSTEVEELRAALRDIAQEDRGGLQNIYNDGGGDDEVIQYLFRRIHARCQIARTALTRTTDQPDPGAQEGSSLPVEAAAQEGQTR